MYIVAFYPQANRLSMRKPSRLWKERVRIGGHSGPARRMGFGVKPHGRGPPFDRSLGLWPALGGIGRCREADIEQGITHRFKPQTPSTAYSR